MFTILYANPTLYNLRNYSGITIDLLKKPNPNLLQYHIVQKVLKTLLTAGMLAFITTCRSYWLSESVTE